MGLDLGRYRLDEPLASSGLSESFLATTAGDNGDAQQVVLERLLPDVEPKAAAVFMEDAYVASRLFHPNIVQTLEVGKAGDAQYVARERVDGIDMLGFLREHVRAGRTPDPAIAAWIAHELLEALDYAHRVSGGIVHGRITMADVVFGMGGEVKLGGFGAARPLRLDGAGALTDLSHTSPEQVNGQPIDARSDVFSVGIVLAELLVARRLFLAGHALDVLVMIREVQLDRFESKAAELDPFLVDIARRALRRDSADRWTTAAEFRDALAGWLRDRRRTTMRDELALVVRELRVLRESHGVAEPVPDVDFKFGRAPTVPPMPGKTLLGVRANRTAPNDGSSQKILTIPQLPAVPGPRATTPGPAVQPPARTVRMDRLPESDSGVVEPPQRDSDVLDSESRSGRTSLGVPPLRGSGVELTLEGDTPETSLGMPPLREPGIQLNLEEPALTASQAAAARAVHHALVVDLDRAPDNTGTFADGSHVRVLFRLMSARATGLLAIGRATTIHTIHLRDGQPQSLWSSEAGDLFGDYLVTKGVVSASQLAAALDKSGTQRGKLADAVVELQLVNAIALMRHLKRHVTMRIVDLCTWSEGRYAWYAGTQDPREAFPLDGNRLAMLGEGAMALGDDVLERWLASHGRTKLRAAEPGVAAEPFQVEGLSNLLDELDGVRSIDALLTRERDRIERARLGRMLYLLVTCELAVP